MITDVLLTVSGANNPGSAISGQAITATAVSTNTIDLGTARDIGEGENLYMVFTVIEAFNTLTSLTMNVITDDNAALSSGTVIGSTGAVVLANLTAGKQYVVRLPAQIASLGERYLGASYTVTGTAPTTGSILAQIVLDIQDGKKFYASGFSVI
jgi:hypothetical protein